MFVYFCLIFTNEAAGVDLSALKRSHTIIAPVGRARRHGHNSDRQIRHKALLPVYN